MTYDIDTTTPAGERRLAKVAQLCEGYGERVQKSVFECRLGEAALQRLVASLQEVVDRHVDSVNIYRFEAALADRRTSLGKGLLHEVGKPWII